MDDTKANPTMSGPAAAPHGYGMPTFATPPTTTLTPDVLAAINVAVGSQVAAVLASTTSLVNAAVVHNPTYFTGGFTNLVTIPGGGNGLVLTLFSFGDAGNNFNGTNYIIPSSGIYRITGLIKLANTGVAGACPAGTSVGIQVYGNATLNFDLMQFDTTNPLRNTIVYQNDTYYTAGTPISFIVYSDVGTQARNGMFTLMRVA